MAKRPRKSDARPDPTLPAPAADPGVEAPPTRARRHAPEEDPPIRGFAVEAARLMGDLHCEDILVLDVRGISSVTDYLVIGSGTSDRQIRSIGGQVEDLAKSNGVARIGSEADGPARWVVLDFVDVIVHVFEPVTRAHYDLEMLWGDAPRVPWQRPPGTARR
jgi:ribosome-associated protein